MIETTDDDSLDQMPTLLGPITNVMYRHENKPEITKVFTEYVELPHCLRRDNKVLEWSKDEFNFLHRRIKSFKTLRGNVFGKYQSSGVRTQKWHLLDHFVDSLRDTVRPAFLHNRL